jgi:TolB protein
MRVTVNGSLNCCPAWSPSGSMLSYVSWVTGVPDIYLANLAQPGRLQRPATAGANVTNQMPAWSPDGNRLAFVSNRSGNYDIWVANRDGGGLQNLTNSAASEVAPTWSPSGTQIAFISDRAGTNQLYVMSATGTGVQSLVTQKVDRPTWSPLNFIAFTIETTSGHDIGIWDFSNPGAPRVLTDGVGSNESPTVAPNGRHIAFFTTRWGRQEIAIIDRAGEHLRRITNTGNNTYPNWQPLVR